MNDPREDPLAFIRQIFGEPPPPPKASDTFVNMKRKLSDCMDQWQGESLEAKVARALLGSFQHFFDEGMHPEKFAGDWAVDVTFFQLVTRYIDVLTDTLTGLEHLGQIRMTAINDYKSSQERASDAELD